MGRINTFRKIKNIFFNLLGFGSPQAIVFNLTAIFLILAVVPTRALSYSPIKCIFKTYILPFIFNNHCPAAGIFANCECPACGMTRAMSRLLHGDIQRAYAFNKLVFLVFIVMIVVLAVNLIKSIKYYKKTGRIL